MEELFSTSQGSALPQKAGLLAMAWFLLLGFMAFTITVHSQPGFISIDCGIAEGSGYRQRGQINYVSDVKFIDSDINRDLPNRAFLDKYSRRYMNVRSFPDGDRNCYTLRPVDKGSKYLIRAGFLYGNYDGQNLSPTFDLYLGVDWWATVQKPTRNMQLFEIITSATMDFVSVCLVNTGKGAPFISVLVLRPLANSMYNATNEDQSLKLIGRFDVGSATSVSIRNRIHKTLTVTSTTYGKNLMYANPYDRVWFYPKMDWGWSRLQTKLKVSDDGFKLPSMAMMTAIVPNGGDIMYFSWTSSQDNQLFHVYKHYADLVPNSVREMTDCCGSSCHGPFVPQYLVAFTVHTNLSSTGGINQKQYSCWFQKTENSALPPILNAIEIYTVLQRSKTTTNQEDGMLSPFFYGVLRHISPV
ncbi:putative leucine-rich repeat receptor-like serine/threonine-protein kinase isoform X1 [Cinnamomum micranthum f. kanehirae]|uniref:Putative leucine-rich repeat receptor-like serine/threonine-protein kinase isoform X1 n=1 Tax=Cinnamomum micranthum f. kanehirae TaxID=337451 RepID=A0A3S3NZ81_9MAGN|nr:putative leucine-rich repeat receptor-like serine/threonine-protein kinase isoform X1 [Cinnamomum micranthum f. kanehirae]